MVPDLRAVAVKAFMNDLVSTLLLISSLKSSFVI